MNRSVDTKPEIRIGDCLEVMGVIEESSIDTIITDPPYGLSFMGKGWDHGVPGVKFWKRALRVTKPGGFLLAFGGTRTFNRLACAIEDAGWEIRDTMMWVYGSGFPKSHNIANSIDKMFGHGPRGRAIPTASLYQACDKGQKNKLTSNKVAEYQARTLEGEPWTGWGTALKPAYEPIIVAMKPLDGTFAQNALKHGVAGLNIDGGRIGTTAKLTRRLGKSTVSTSGWKSINRSEVAGKDGGRWPANVILSHSPDCVPVRTEKVKGRTINRWKDGAKPFGGGAGHKYESAKMGDDTVEVYACVPGCPVRMMDGQTGKLKSGVAVRRRSGGNTFGGDNPKPPMDDMGYNDSGGASRFFYCAKAGKKERNAGLDSIETVLLRCVSWENEVHEVRLLVDTEPSLRRATVVSGVPKSDAIKWSMLLFGNNATVGFLKGCRFITGTEIRSTTGSPTLSLLRQRLTNVCTEVASSKKVSGRNRVGIVENGRQLIVEIGTARKKVGLCTEGVDRATLKSLLKRSKRVVVESRGFEGCVHPTVKPLDLMRYLCRLTKTPTGGIILDPFLGSGTTIIAAALEDRKGIGIEISKEYAEIAQKRIDEALQSDGLFG